MRMTMILGILAFTLALVTEVVKADFIFGTPSKVPNVSISSDDANSEISPDGLSLFFTSGNKPGGYGSHDIWVATRATTEDEWSQPINLGPPVNSSAFDSQPSISADGLHLYFSDGRADDVRPLRDGGYGGADLWVSTRPTKYDPWGEPVNLGPTINSSATESDPSISDDGLTLFFQSDRPGGYGRCDIYVTMRATTSDPWGPPMNLGPTVNSVDYDGDLDISSDGLALFFDSDRPGRYGDYDLWVSRRATTNDPWEEPMNLGPSVNSDIMNIMNVDPSISYDASTLYFARGVWATSGTWDIWQAPVLPVVDLNSDGIVDSADVSIMVDFWGTDEPLCDIGPSPWGDGIVDVQDLIVLAEHLFKEIFPFELIAYWKLDEEESDIAYNSIDDNHGVLHGNPIWQPDSGQIAGAMEFNGIDNYISTDFVLDPSWGAFSVFTWIKGGAPGQVIISQMDGIGTGETWLGADMSEGKLMTGLVTSPLGRFKPTPLEPAFVITDGLWHHIGFVWDCSYRALYVDGIEVSRDTKALTQALTSSIGGLYIGAGKNLDAGTFFSGMIDDVRIYNVALTAEEIATLAQ